MKRIVLLFIFILSIITLQAQSIAKGSFTTKIKVVPNNYNFWVYTPGDYNDDTHKRPLIIFLHGASLCGTDINKVRKYGVLNAIERGKIVPALVLAPQNPGGAWSPRKINELLEWMEDNYRIDQTRVYVIGMSLGGYGTLDFAGTYPEKVAAAMALCGGTSLKNLDGLSNFPLWIMHGTADKAVSITQSKRIATYLHNNHEDDLLRTKWFEGGSHGLLARLFYLQKTYDWLFAHSTTDKPRYIDTFFDIDQNDLKETYDELRWFKGMFDDD